MAQQNQQEQMEAPSRSREPRNESGAMEDRGATGRRERGDTARTSTSGARRARSPDLQKDLRDFAMARPQGWSHDDWLHFLEDLQSRGHNINDRDAIGMALERERLDLALSSVKGVGPQRRRTLVQRFGTVWNLRNAEPDEIASVGGIPRNLAEQIKSEIH